MLKAGKHGKVLHPTPKVLHPTVTEVRQKLEQLKATLDIAPDDIEKIKLLKRELKSMINKFVSVRMKE